MDEEKTQQLKLVLIREYDALAPVIAKLRRVPVEVAREALHTAICKILTGLAKRPPDDRVINWRPYIVQAAVNELKMQAREENGLRLFGGEKGALAIALACAPGLNHTTTVEEREFAALAWKELQNLSEPQREVITRRCKSGDPYSQIALAMGIAESTARVHFHDGIVDLRKRLGVGEGDLAWRKKPRKEAA